ncbi:hypothetical protein DRJ17_02125 [Candidatus Woesearchaeota archaeon]|nr:MAG: hypothetical protein DRJ17_02125 [Candidatus Woesearchaeota archaeon]
MQSKIVFLGTAGGFEVVGKQLRASGGIVIQTEGLQFLIDPGPGCLAKAQEYGINIRQTNAIFLSHIHYGHSNDLNVSIQAMTLNGLDKRGFLLASKEVLKDVPKDSKDKLQQVVEVSPGKRVRINNVEIIPIIAQHNVPCLSFKIISKDFTLVYVSDTRYIRELEKEVRNVDVLLCNCKLPAGIKDGNNLNTSDVIRLANKTRPLLVIITHFGSEMLKKDPLFEARDIQREIKIHTIAAKDGMIINPTSYAAKVRQRTLLGFAKKEG